jgi:hypothetical protein
LALQYAAAVAIAANDDYSAQQASQSLKRHQPKLAQSLRENVVCIRQELGWSLSSSALHYVCETYLNMSDCFRL